MGREWLTSPTGDVSHYRRRAAIAPAAANVAQWGLMTRKQLDAWLGAYGRAWEQRDPEAVVRLFTPDALYYETPFLKPARGRVEIREYWAAATGKQEEVCFSHEVLAVSGRRGMARWQSRFRRGAGGSRVRLDGVFVLEFDQDGLCRELREWWHRAGGARG